MGAERNTYIGVYLRINNTEKTITEQYYVKPSGNKAKTRFNPETGEEHKLVSKEKTVVVRFNHYEVLEDFEDSLFSPEYVDGNNNTINGYTTLLANTSHEDFSITLDECETIELDHFSPKIAMSLFQEYYKEELQILKDKNINFTIHYGVVNYAH